ncbi:uncharacterized protein PV07_01728 [Cladophialophora immunda]|uniref:Uncharacterized protein n=1 Tax=Cladophialophora immunda TaxID=569365 RepID=A0A0D2A409_9EURO|nr:uncharacterized protein PV07_01728 [Cladophialophora immunda]KIW35001.1 hypothetical protein PV07_01728 [Cladophialophora immunda]
MASQCRPFIDEEVLCTRLLAMQLPIPSVLLSHSHTKIPRFCHEPSSFSASTRFDDRSSRPGLGGLSTLLYPATSIALHHMSLHRGRLRSHPACFQTSADGDSFSASTTNLTILKWRGSATVYTTEMAILFASSIL